MLETIKAQLQNRKLLTKHNFYVFQSSPQVAAMVGDMYPHWADYYHEMNPAFLFNVSRPELLDQYSAITVRDGSAIVGGFILKNYQTLGNSKTHFVIAPEQAKLVPPNLRHKFSSWSIYQHQSTPIEKASRILISGIVADDTLCSMSEIAARLQCLRQTPDSVPIDIFLPQRRNPLSNVWRESYVHYEIIELLKELKPGKKFNYISTSELIGNTSYSGTYYINLMSDLAVSDSYLSHHIANRGGTVAQFKHTADPGSYFELDLSFTHRIEFIPLPECDSIFAEMIFYKKQTAQKDYYADPYFHNIIRTK